MDFAQTDDRRMLADSLTRYLAANYPIEHRNAVAYAPPFHDPAQWDALAALGILFALAPEAHGGFGGSGFDIFTVFQTLGHALCPEPVLPALLAARLLARTKADLDPLLSGATRYAVAIGEPDAPFGVEDIATQATRSGGNWTLSGRKSVVYGAQAAHRLLVVARAETGLGLFEIEAAAAEITAYAMIDGGGAGEVFLDATPSRLILPEAVAAVEDALDAGALALSAEAVGAMDAARDMMLAYLRTRTQFGTGIGKFQVLQHRSVEMATEIEQARSLTILAASRLGGPDASRTVSMCKNLVGRTAQLVAEETIQMQGGIAMTWDYAAAHFAKRLTMIDAQLGDADRHLARVMAALQAPDR